MKKIIGKLFSTLLAITMVLTLLPFGGHLLKASAETSGVYTYSVSNGKATITKCDPAASGNIVIPSTLGGYPVTAIGRIAFDNCDSLTRVIIPNSVTSMGYFAFSDCDGLISITIPASVTSIDESQNPYGILFVSPGSYAENFAINHDLSYLANGSFSIAYKEKYDPSGYVPWVQLLSRDAPLSVTLEWYQLYRSCHITLFILANNFDYKSVRWKSDNSKVLIDKNGYITNKGVGARAVVIKAELLDGNGNVIGVDSAHIVFHKFPWQWDNLARRGSFN